LSALGKKPLEGVNDKLHRRVIVVEHQYLVHSRLFRLRLGLNDDAGARSFPALFAVVAHPDPSRWRKFAPNDIGFATVGERPLRARPIADRHVSRACAHSARYGRVSRPSIIISIAMP